MMVKSHASISHIDDLKETFAILYKYQMKLNPAKCIFRVTSRKFLGFMVSHQGVKAKPEKILAVRQMGAPKIVKEVQRLIAWVTALSQFVSKLAEQCLLFFQTLKKLKDF